MLRKGEVDFHGEGPSLHVIPAHAYSWYFMPRAGLRGSMQSISKGQHARGTIQVAVYLFQTSGHSNAVEQSPRIATFASLPRCGDVASPSIAGAICQLLTHTLVTQGW